MLTIAYDGSNYNGWQTGDGKNGIEDILNHIISKATNENIKIIGASRTDSGVHSNGNVAVFDTNSDIRPDKFNYVLNNLLPEDISILSSKEVDISFNPRKADVKKTYIYRLHIAKVRNPLKEHNAHFVYYDVDINKMIEGAKYLIGVHDFKSFVNPDAQLLQYYKKNDVPSDFNVEKLTTREIYNIDIKKDDDIISIKIEGNGFLYHMIRIICGTLLKVGMNMWEPPYIKEILQKKDRKFAGFTLPAKGLTLQSIDFL